ncbi:MAG: RNA-processing protein [Marine Group II euryarchaeote MED-G34]|nr:MAG: RNA-processing protein [Marine Group II euryarchaeote MED-G34]
MEYLARIPQDRIAVLIGKGGETRRMIEEACGATLEIDSKSGEVMAEWGDEGADPIVRMKMPDVIVAIGRGLAPKRAVQLIRDEVFLKMYDIREWAGRQPNQTRRMRSRLIGRNGRIRSLIEEISSCEMAIYGSTVLVIGDEDGLALAAPAIEGILRGSEHSTILHGLEQDRKRQRLRSRRLESYEEHSPDESSTFETLVPGLAEARRRRERRYRDSQVDPDDEEEVSSMLDLADDEEIVYEEE